MKQRASQQGDLTLVNIYVPNIGAPKIARQILTDKGRDQQ